jgi:hypothetical protein
VQALFIVDLPTGGKRQAIHRAPDTPLPRCPVCISPLWLLPTLCFVVSAVHS